MKTILKLIMHILPSAKQQGTHVQPDNACNICLGISISLSDENIPSIDTTTVPTTT
jgi:hypothetical protein